MRIQGQLTERDSVAALFLHVQPRRSFAVAGILLVALAILVAGSFAISAWRRGDSLWSPIVIVAVLGYLAANFLGYLPYQTRRTFRQQKGAELPFQVTVDNEGLRLESQLATGFVPWTHVHKWREGRTLFLLYRSDALYHVVPKRFFDSAQQVTAFREMLERHARRVP